MNGFGFLEEFSNEELAVLVEIIKDKGSFSESLTSKSNYRDYYPNHRMYVREIEQELSDMGANSIANAFRSFFSDTTGVEYNEILKDVCDKMDVSYDSSDSEREIEVRLLAKVMESSWTELSSQEQQQLLDGVNGQVKGSINVADKFGLFCSIFRAGGFKSYKLSVIIANTIAKMILGRGLSLAANAALTRGLAILTGPIGWAITAIWTAIDLSGPAYRVTVPSVIYIAALRQIKI